jgi:hypothetical protein
VKRSWAESRNADKKLLLLPENFSSGSFFLPSEGKNEAEE